VFEGLIFGLIVSVGVAFGCWSESPLKNGFISGSIGGLLSGTIVGLIYRQGSVLGELLFGLMCGPIVGVIAGLGVGSLNHIILVEAVSWKWKKFWKRTILALLTILTGGLILFFLIYSISENFVTHDEFGKGMMELVMLFIVFFGLIFGLAFGLVGGFTGKVIVDKVSPNQGIKLSLKTSFAVYIVTVLIFGSTLGFPGPVIGLLVGLNRGGSAVIKHYALRLSLWLNGFTPFKFVKFLDQCARLILLKRVGGGYIFIHRMLLDYFADMNPQSTRVEESVKNGG
jgi:hypothetical protein